MHKTAHGFTLVELAIALMVIGLLIGGVLKGQELIESARITATIRQITSYDTATMIFRNTYGSLPGDIKRPNRIPNCTEELCNVAGNGNGKIEPGNEAFNIFVHLTKAGMIQGPEGGTEDQMNEVNSDRASADSVLFFPMTPLDVEIETQLVTTHLGQHNAYYIPPHNLANQTPLSVKTMITLDTKIDDGKPDSGFVIVDYLSACPTMEVNGIQEYDMSFSGATYCPLSIKTGW